MRFGVDFGVGSTAVSFGLAARGAGVAFTGAAPSSAAASGSVSAAGGLGVGAARLSLRRCGLERGRPPKTSVGGCSGIAPSNDRAPGHWAVSARTVASRYRGVVRKRDSTRPERLSARELLSQMHGGAGQNATVRCWNAPGGGIRSVLTVWRARSISALERAMNPQCATTRSRKWGRNLKRLAAFYVVVVKPTAARAAMAGRRRPSAAAASPSGRLTSKNIAPILIRMFE